MMWGSGKLRAGAVLAAGALAVHELRYLIAYGGDARRVLEHQGHAYLGLVTLGVGVVMAWVIGGLLVRLAGRDSADRRRRHRRSGTWSAASLTLFAAYCLQELVEGLLAQGHADGFAAVLGHGGWVALPLTLAVGGLVALALHGADAAGDLGPPFSPSPPWLGLSSRLGCPSGRLLPFPGDVLARHLAGRAPPPLSTR